MFNSHDIMHICTHLHIYNKQTEYLANYGIVGVGSLFGLLGAIICVIKNFF
jgi:hypothetical protein